jgi:hypothetical protein
MFQAAADRPQSRYGPAVRMLLVLLAGAAIGLVAWLVIGGPSGDEPVTRAQIEQTVAKRPRGQVQVVLCNEEVIPSRRPAKDPPHTWTCDTYIGPSKADAQNGPSYQVLVSNDRKHIQSVRRVPTH